MKRYPKILIVFTILNIVLMLVLNDFEFLKKVNLSQNELVPDEITAVKIAEAIWLPIYGDEIYKSSPFNAEYNSKKKCWVVTGTLPNNMLGGVPEIVIKKSNGTILYINHGK